MQQGICGARARSSARRRTQRPSCTRARWPSFLRLPHAEAARGAARSCSAAERREHARMGTTRCSATPARSCAARTLGYCRCTSWSATARVLAGRPDRFGRPRRRRVLSRSHPVAAEPRDANPGGLSGDRAHVCKQHHRWRVCLCVVCGKFSNVSGRLSSLRARQVSSPPDDSVVRLFGDAAAPAASPLSWGHRHAAHRCSTSESTVFAATAAESTASAATAAESAASATADGNQLRQHRR